MTPTRSDRNEIPTALGPHSWIVEQVESFCSAPCRADEFCEGERQIAEEGQKLAHRNQ